MFIYLIGSICLMYIYEMNTHSVFMYRIQTEGTLNKWVEVVKADVQDLSMEYWKMKKKTFAGDFCYLEVVKKKQTPPKRGWETMLGL